MPLASGTKLGALEIVGQLGKGGMGEVYRARDSRLQRDVAVKVLPGEFSASPERVLRFRREAEILAALNHPHIAAIYDVSDSENYRFLVMELVEGETLAERLTHGPMPLPELFKTAIQIAGALEAAHEKDIVHRDLKPSNIKLDGAGNVKVLDFGLAKVGGSQSGNLSNSPTMVTVDTERALLGTAAYMAPEQARGKEAGRASDVWAFGCVLYEMLTGKMAFDGETTAEILAGVLKSDPTWSALPSNTPEGIRRLLRRCLQKDVKSRFRDMSDVRIELTAAQSEPAFEPRAATSGSRRTERILWILTLAVAAAVAVAAYFNRTPPPQLEMRVDISTPPTSQPTAIALSPNGQKLVFVSNDRGRSKLWIRSLDAGTARPLSGTDFATFPFWSPDGNSIGFFADEKLKRIDVNGGTPIVLANAPIPRGGAWSNDGTIFFAPMAAGPIYKISANGGRPEAATRLLPNQNSHRFPQILPDGRILYLAFGSADGYGSYVAQRDGTDARRLDVRTDVVFAPTGHLLLVRGNTLLAQAFDPNRLQASGDPFLIAENVAVGSFRGASVSAADGLILFRPQSGGGRRQLAWFDRSGKELQRIGTSEDALGMNPSVSPDGRRVALHRGVAGTDVWLLELGRDVFTRLTLHPASDVYPIWSPDGKRIVFASNRNGTFNLYEKASGGSGDDAVFLETEQNKTATDWSPDGKFILFQTLDLETNDDIWALPITSDKKPIPVVRTQFAERDAQFAPDGHWIAYQSNESGRFEIYVRSFPDGSVKSQITNQGGTQVRWRRDGKELFYIAPDGRLVAVPIRLASNHGAIEVGAGAPLFITQVGDAIQGTEGPHYAASPDGTRFLINTLVEEQAAPLTLIVNWKGRAGSQ